MKESLNIHHNLWKNEMVYSKCLKLFFFLIDKISFETPPKPKNDGMGGKGGLCIKSRPRRFSYLGKEGKQHEEEGRLAALSRRHRFPDLSVGEPPAASSGPRTLIPVFSRK